MFFMARTGPNVSHATISHRLILPTPTFPTAWHQIINDPMNEQTHGENWAINQGCSFHTEAYVQTSSGLNYCNDGDSDQQSFHNLDYAVDLSIHHGNRGGLVFRLRHGNYYYFSITLTGSYELLRHDTTDNGQDTSIATGFASVIHHLPNQWNTIRIIAQDNAFQLWINGHYITTAHDNIYSQGTIGIAVSEGQSSPLTEVWFRHAQVRLP